MAPSQSSLLAAAAAATPSPWAFYSPRAMSSADWSDADRQKLAAVVRADGQFGGTCDPALSSLLPPQPGAGQCESYYPDVTLYCCGAVGGDPVSTYARKLTNEMSSYLPEKDQAALDANPYVLSCQTVKSADMLLCYKYTAEEHCRSAISGPWGVCNTAEASGNSTSSAEQQVTIATGATSDAPASLRLVGGAGAAALTALAITSALLLAIGQAA